MTPNQERWAEVAEAGRKALEALRDMRAARDPVYRAQIDRLIDGNRTAFGLEALIEEAETRANDVELEVR